MGKIQSFHRHLSSQCWGGEGLGLPGRGEDQVLPRLTVGSLLHISRQQQSRVSHFQQATMEGSFNPDCSPEAVNGSPKHPPTPIPVGENIENLPTLPSLQPHTAPVYRVGRAKGRMFDLALGWKVVTGLRVDVTHPPFRQGAGGGSPWCQSLHRWQKWTVDVATCYPCLSRKDPDNNLLLRIQTQDEENNVMSVLLILPYLS